MGENSKISWTDCTFNPWIGCGWASPGCDNCYAQFTWARLKLKPGERKRTSPAYWRQPLKWNALEKVCADCGQPVKNTGTAIDCACGQAGAIGKMRRQRVFCGSLCDWLDDKVPAQWTFDLIDIIQHTPNLNWLLLTKRIENWKDRLDVAHQYAMFFNRPDVARFISQLLYAPPPNVWIGVTAENQEQWDKRVPVLMQIPAARRFVSVEPMLENIDMTYATFNGADSFGSMPGISWVILGGESGPKARPCHIEWIKDGVEQCRVAGVACFVKQLGSNAHRGGEDPSETKMSLNHKKGGDPAEWPADLRVQEWPK